jgi:hypothetical protein
VNFSDWIAAASLGVALAALMISWYAIVRANKTTSAATLVALNEGFRQAWERCLQLRPTEQQAELTYQLAELLNLLEIACGVYLERSVSGNSRQLLVEYLNGVLSLLIKNPSFSNQIPQLLQTEKTFIFIKRFIKEKPKSLSVTIPPNWYQLPP